MRRVLRENALCALAAGLCSLAVAWLTLYGSDWNDYEFEVRPAYEALTHGHLLAFLRLAPVYGGSLLERAPFALLPNLWGGGSLAVYRAVAVPCLLAGALLGIWLVARMRTAGSPRLARAIVLGLCVANPITLSAMEVGHPEELLGGCLCAAAVLLAGAREVSLRRSILAGLLLGLAIANKQWALLACGPVLLSLPPGRRLACLGMAIVSAAAVLAPLAIGSSGNFASQSGAIASSGSAVFQPWQMWWFFGHHGALVHGLLGAAKPGYRIGPGWAGTISHPLVLLVGVAVAAALWVRSGRRRRLPADQALLALALLLLARCVLDTWDTSYYPLPFVLALVTWDATRPSSQPPVLALTASVLVWFNFNWLPGHLSPDGQSALFLAWSLPLTAWLGRRSFARPAGSTPPVLADLGDAAQPMTVSAFGSRVSTSLPVGLTTARSSIRTPSASGR
jgi:Glycosyltransferase family 87